MRKVTERIKWILASYFIFALVQGAMLIAVLEQDASLDALTLGVIVWGSVPFLMDALLVLAVRRRAIVKVVTALTWMLSLIDLALRYSVLFQPQNSTDAIAVLFIPVLHWSLTIVISIGAFAINRTARLSPRAPTPTCSDPT